MRRARGPFGRVDFAYYPFEPVGKIGTWQGLRIDALVDMAVNKVQAVLTRFQPRDFVDPYFLLHEPATPGLEKLLDLARAKFDSGVHAMGLAARLLLVHDIRELPAMIRPVTIPTLVAYFETLVRAIAKGN